MTDWQTKKEWGMIALIIILSILLITQSIFYNHELSKIRQEKIDNFEVITNECPSCVCHSYSISNASAILNTTSIHNTFIE